MSLLHCNAWSNPYHRMNDFRASIHASLQRLHAVPGILSYSRSLNVSGDSGSSLSLQSCSLVLVERHRNGGMSTYLKTADIITLFGLWNHSDLETDIITLFLPVNLCAWSCAGDNILVLPLKSYLCAHLEFFTSVMDKHSCHDVLTGNNIFLCKC
jgi:hypothetical protein